MPHLCYLYQLTLHSFTLNFTTSLLWLNLIGGPYHYISFVSRKYSTINIKSVNFLRTWFIKIQSNNNIFQFWKQYLSSSLSCIFKNSYWLGNQRILKSNKCFFKTVFSVVYRSLSRNDHLLLSKLDQKHHHGMTI